MYLFSCNLNGYRSGGAREGDEKGNVHVHMRCRCAVPVIPTARLLWLSRP